MTPRSIIQGARMGRMVGTGDGEADQTISAQLEDKAPARITLPAVGASVCASGSQVWKGTAGRLDDESDQEADESQRAAVKGNEPPAWMRVL